MNIKYLHHALHDIKALSPTFCCNAITLRWWPKGPCLYSAALQLFIQLTSGLIRRGPSDGIFFIVRQLPFIVLILHIVGVGGLEDSCTECL